MSFEEVKSETVKTVEKARDTSVLKWDHIKDLLLKAENEAGSPCGFCYLVANLDSNRNCEICPVNEKCNDLEILDTIAGSIIHVREVLKYLRNIDIEEAQKNFNIYRMKE